MSIKMHYIKQRTRGRISANLKRWRQKYLKNRNCRKILGPCAILSLFLVALILNTSQIDIDYKSLFGDEMRLPVSALIMLKTGNLRNVDFIYGDFGKFVFLRSYDDFFKDRK